MKQRRKGMVEIDMAPLAPYLRDDLAATVRSQGARCDLAGDVPCPASGRTVRFTFDLSHPPAIYLSIAVNKRPTDDEVRWWFRFSNILRGVEHAPQQSGAVRNFTIGNTGDFVTLIPAGAA